MRADASPSVWPLERGQRRPPSIASDARATARRTARRRRRRPCRGTRGQSSSPRRRGRRDRARTRGARGRSTLHTGLRRGGSRRPRSKQRRTRRCSRRQHRARSRCPDLRRRGPEVGRWSNRSRSVQRGARLKEGRSPRRSARSVSCNGSRVSAKYGVRALVMLAEPGAPCDACLARPRRDDANACSSSRDRQCAWKTVPA